jgi:hypothetical protein
MLPAECQQSCHAALVNVQCSAMVKILLKVKVKMYRGFEYKFNVNLQGFEYLLPILCILRCTEEFFPALQIKTIGLTVDNNRGIFSY